MSSSYIIIMCVPQGQRSTLEQKLRIFCVELFYKIIWTETKCKQCKIKLARH